jgi:hypothetical protein
MVAITTRFSAYFVAVAWRLAITGILESRAAGSDY